MYNIKYLLVNDAGSKSRACNSRHRFIPHIGHCISTAVNAQDSSTSWSSCVSTGPTPKYWESQNWTSPPLMLPSE